MSQVLVDDTNPNIQYYGPWFTAQNTQLNTGTNGPPFQNTLHGVNVNASFSYSFSGSQVIVLGTSITTNASGTQDPTWECSVDNISIGWGISAGTGTENNWDFCQSTLQDGPHILSMNVTVLHQQTFWLDQIQYTPSSNVLLDNSTVRIGYNNPAVQYSSGWIELDGIVNLTQTAGSTVTYEFFGISVSWLGFVPSNFSLTSTSAIYSIDGQTPIAFFVPALSGTLPLYDQVFFKSLTLSPEQHELIVTYQGNSGTAPLALDAFIVQNGISSATSTLPGATSTSSSVPSSTPSDLTSTTGSNKSPLVGIIVGVVGGVIALALLLSLYIFRCRRHNRRAQRAQNLDEISNPEPFTLSPRNYTSSARSLTPQAFSSSKVFRSGEPTDSPGTSILTSLPSSRISPISPAIRNSETMPLMQPSTSAQSADLGFLQHADSGVRMPVPHAQGNLVELPPAYTSG